MRSSRKKNSFNMGEGDFFADDRPYFHYSYKTIIYYYCRQCSRRISREKPYYERNGWYYCADCIQEAREIAALKELPARSINHSTSQKQKRRQRNDHQDR